MDATAVPSPKQRFLEAYESEHATTMKVLRAYPQDKLDLRPHEKCKTAKELAWVFAVERGLGTMVMHDTLADADLSEMPEPPDSWDGLLQAIDGAHRSFGDLVASLPDEQLFETAKFFTAPQTMGDVQRLDFLWFMLSDQIHHRGQFSIYLRMADGRVPSIYGPSADEPWM
jgi:uncharacterized damage-inducible protein DinB